MSIDRQHIETQRSHTTQSKANEHRFYKLYEVMFDGMVIHDGEKVVDVNQQFASMFGYTAEELVGVGIFELVDSQSQKTIENHIHNSFEEMYEATGCRKNGETFPMEIVARTLPSEGEYFRVAAVRDITDRRAALDKIQLQVAQQKALLTVSQAVQNMTRPSDLALVAHVCFEQLKIVGLRFSALAIQRIVDPINGVFAFFEMQPSGSFHQFIGKSPNLFRLWRLGKVVYRPNLDHDLGGLSLFDRKALAARYQRPVKSILNIGFDLGLLSVLSDEVDPFTNEEIAFMEQCASVISLGMHRLQDMEQLDAVVRHLPQGICLFDSYQQLAFANELGKAYLGVLGISANYEGAVHIDGCSLSDLCRTTKDVPHRIVIADEIGTAVDVVARPVREEGAANGWVVVLRDVTQELQAEVFSRRQDRLASVGQLAAGIAHDLNNMLTVMSGFAQILEMNPDLDVQTKDDLAQISQQGQRGATLVRQILDFSRETDIARQPLDILPFLKEAVKLFQRTLPETIVVGDTFPLGNYVIQANITQLQQVLNNLAVNARDAMPNGGKLTFAAQHVLLDEGTAVPVVGMKKGAWLKVSVSDTGSGMAPATLDRIFEPFFTTKEVTEGTGLGLAQVYGIVSQHDGLIDVESKLGKGTTFSLYFPLASEEADDVDMSQNVPIGNEECVLVVEDNDVVLQSLQKILECLNYRVLAAKSVKEALALIELRGQTIDVILTDLVMPNGSGLDLFDSLQAQGISIPLAVMTGYHHEALRVKEHLREKGILILKPILLSVIAEQVHKLLHTDLGG